MQVGSRFTKMTSTVIVQHRAPGFHYYPGAQGTEVAFLANRHRHLFLFVVGWKVDGLDRDIEFFIAQKWLREAYPADGHGIDFGAKSCEMIAKEIAEKLQFKGHPAPSFVEVWEDEENGGRVDFESVEA